MEEFEMCDICRRVLPVVQGVTDDDEVAWQADPHNAEINGDYTEMWLCGKCYVAALEEI